MHLVEAVSLERGFLEVQIVSYPHGPGEHAKTRILFEPRSKIRPPLFS